MNVMVVCPKCGRSSHEPPREGDLPSKPPVGHAPDKNSVGKPQKQSKREIAKKTNQDDFSDGHLLDFLHLLFTLTFYLGAPVLGGTVGYMLGGSDGCLLGVGVGFVVTFVVAQGFI
jgi:hypothetical protein